MKLNPHLVVYGCSNPTCAAAGGGGYQCLPGGWQMASFDVRVACRDVFACSLGCAFAIVAGSKTLAVAYGSPAEGYCGSPTWIFGRVVWRRRRGAPRGARTDRVVFRYGDWNTIPMHFSRATRRCLHAVESLPNDWRIVLPGERVET